MQVVEVAVENQQDFDWHKLAIVGLGIIVHWLIGVVVWYLLPVHGVIILSKTLLWKSRYRRSMLHDVLFIMIYCYHVIMDLCFIWTNDYDISHKSNVWYNDNKLFSVHKLMNNRESSTDDFQNDWCQCGT